jgi:hypothetical protein
MKPLIVLLLTVFLTGCLASAKYKSMTSEERVSEIQRDLKVLGYHNGSVDGIYGKKTAIAIRNFQRDRGITQDGKVSQSVYIQAGLAVTEKRKVNSVTRSNLTQTTNNKIRNGSTTQILQSRLKPPVGSPSNAIIEKAVRKELQKNVPGRWIGYTIPGKVTQYRHMEIKRWGTFNKELKYWPVRIQVVGGAVVIPPFGKKISGLKFDAIAEFKFSKDDFGDWKWIFMRPGVF